MTITFCRYEFLTTLKKRHLHKDDLEPVFFLCPVWRLSIESISFQLPKGLGYFSRSQGQSKIFKDNKFYCYCCLTAVNFIKNWRYKRFLPYCLFSTANSFFSFSSIFFKRRFRGRIKLNDLKKKRFFFYFQKNIFIQSNSRINEVKWFFFIQLNDYNKLNNFKLNILTALWTTLMVTLSIFLYILDFIEYEWDFDTKSAKLCLYLGNVSRTDNNTVSLMCWLLSFFYIIA